MFERALDMSLHVFSNKVCSEETQKNGNSHDWFVPGNSDLKNFANFQEKDPPGSALLNNVGYLTIPGNAFLGKL